MLTNKRCRMFAWIKTSYIIYLIIFIFYFLKRACIYIFLYFFYVFTGPCMLAVTLFYVVLPVLNTLAKEISNLSVALLVEYRVK